MYDLVFAYLKVDFNLLVYCCGFFQTVMCIVGRLSKQSNIKTDQLSKFYRYRKKKDILIQCELKAALANSPFANRKLFSVVFCKYLTPTEKRDVTFKLVCTFCILLSKTS